MLLSVLIGFPIVLYGFLIVVIWLGQPRLIFSCPSSVTNVTPSDIQLNYQEVRLSVGQGSEVGTVVGWWVPVNDPSAPVILYFHGNASNLEDQLDIVNCLNRLGWNCFVFDYRGYGNSQGPFPNEKRIYEDAEAVLNYLLHEKHIPLNRIIFYGYSLGGAVAIHLALQYSCAALILQGVFSSMLDMVRLKNQYRFFPVRFILNQHFDSVKKISSLQMPKLFLQGQRDTVVPDEMGQRLYRLASEPKQLVLLPQAGHNNISFIDTSTYHHSLKRFISENCS